MNVHAKYLKQVVMVYFNLTMDITIFVASSLIFPHLNFRQIKIKEGRINLRTISKTTYKINRGLFVMKCLVKRNINSFEFASKCEFHCFQIFEDENIISGF